MLMFLNLQRVHASELARHCIQPSQMLSAQTRLLAAWERQQAESGALLTDVVIFDMNDELGQGLEVQPASAKPANVGEEGGSRDARHNGCVGNGPWACRPAEAEAVRDEVI